MPKTLSGPPALYRPKDARPLTINLTTYGRARLDAVAAECGLSRADVVELLVRAYGQPTLVKALAMEVQP